MNLVEGLSREIERNKEILGYYEDIGPAGQFGASFIRQDLDEAHQAMGSGDVIRMMQIFQTLKERKS